MSKSVHAHKVLNLLREQALSQDELLLKIESDFGTDVSFHTCSREGFDVQSLLTFFIAKQKVTLSDGKVHLNAERVCSH